MTCNRQTNRFDVGLNGGRWEWWHGASSGHILLTEQLIGAQQQLMWLAELHQWTTVVVCSCLFTGLALLSHCEPSTIPVSNYSLQPYCSAETDSAFHPPWEVKWVSAFGISNTNKWRNYASYPEKFSKCKNVLEVLYHHAKFGGAQISAVSENVEFLSVRLSVTLLNFASARRHSCCVLVNVRYMLLPIHLSFCRL